MSTRSNTKKIYSIVLLIFVICTISQKVKAQFDGSLSQYTYSKNFFNPASLGELNMAKASLAHRIQWIGIKNAPQTTFASLALPFKIQKRSMAAGLTITNDVFGIFRYQNINMQYAYTLPLAYGELNIGTNLGALNLTIHGDSAHIAESDYHTPAANDPAIPNKEETGTSLDVALAGYFTAPNWYVGLSVNHLNAPTIEVGAKNDFSIQPLMTLLAGSTLNINTNWKLYPSLLLISDFVSWQTYLSGQVEYKNKFLTGLTYSYQNALGILIGMNVTNEITIGYTYDLPISEIIKSTTGSHEIYLSYEFNLALNQKNKKHKSVRIL